jgi:L-amino acid N-acyltransferase YncA
VATLRVRPAIEADVPELPDIYNHYVLTSPATFDVQPVTIRTRLEWFRRHAAEGSSAAL